MKEMKKILAQDEQRLSMEEVARNVPLSQQGEAMRQILKMAYVDGFLAPLERQMVEQVGRIWKWPEWEIQQFIEEAETNHHINNDDAQLEQSIDVPLPAPENVEHNDDAQLEQSIDVPLPASENVEHNDDAQLEQSIDVPLPASENVEHNLEEPPREILLEGPEYDAAIQQCAAIAAEDYKLAKLALEGTESALTDLASNIQEVIEKIQRKANNKGQASTAKDVARQLENTRKTLTTEILQEIESVHESLNAKQRALNHFTIAFMGKTKAGKSTLHAIITGGGWDAIGAGKQRTTLTNRIYEWNNIRMIDTPGIGAPGGQTDEEIAESIIEESDLICYVVTDDSIQETEFGFLHLLKEKAKPLMVLLNVKKNLRDSRRLEHFLKDPDKLFAMEGQSGLGGHIKRIRSYAKEHYANDYFDIIPVLLLAAQMSRESEHEKRKDELFQASRIQAFLDSIRMSLVKYGPIRRSQTLLGSTVGEIENPCKRLAKQAQAYKELIDLLKTERKNVQKQIEAAAKDNGEALQQKIKSTFQDAINAVPYFAEEHWESNEIKMKLGWEQKLKSIRFEERLKDANQEIRQKFNKDVQKNLEEIGNELELIAKLNGGYYSFQEQDSMNFRNLFRISGILLSIASVVLFFLAPPVGVGVGISAGVVGLITGFFKSKEEKRREAVQKISSSLKYQLSNHQHTALQQAKENFNQSCESVKTNINNYFEELIAGLEAISIQLQEAESQLSDKANYLNCAYAKRIIDWCTEQHEPLTDYNINKAIVKTERNFGRNISIFTKSKLPIKISQEEMKRVFQEDVTIQIL